MQAAVVGTGGERTFALRLAHLYPDRELTPALVTDDSLALVMSLDGHTDSCFVIQMVARPAEPGRGRLELHLIASVRGADGEPATDARVAEVCDDLLDVMSAPPLRWEFEPVRSGEALAAVLDPVEPAHVAEIARREEPCTPIDWNPFFDRPAGFVKREASTDDRVRTLWSMWTFGEPTTDLRRLASVLLAQEAPVAVRVSLRPTALSDDESDEIERLLMSTLDRMKGETSMLARASLATIESVLYCRPTFEMRCLFASSAPISRSLLSAFGNSISEPAEYGKAAGGHLTGGFGVNRGRSVSESDALRSCFVNLGDGPPSPGLAPDALRRLRHVLGAREAANVFRLPVTEDDFPGMTSLDTPDLEPPLAMMPTTGHRIGILPTHGRRTVLIDPEERFRHLYVSGQTGTGKSTLLFNLAMQDICSGAGVAVLDPHGDLVEAILRSIPEERVDDVVLVDPADRDAVVGVNLLEAETPVQQEYVVTELCAMFSELFDPHNQGIVGPRFETMLRQAALLLLANPEQPSSMLDISSLFVDDAIRAHLVRAIEDPILKEFWLGEMKMERSREWQEAVSWFRSKFEIFRTSRLVRNVVGQARSTISFSEILDQQRILLVNLSKGTLGGYNSGLIGYVAFTRLWSAALERASMPASERRDFFVYVDEFQNMTSRSLPDVLSEARKFRVGVTLANQFFTQIPEETRDAIMGNVSNRITFRLGPKDAGPFSSWLGRDVHADDLTNVPNYVAIASISERGVPLDPMVVNTDPPLDSGRPERAAEVRERSRQQWAKPVDTLDEEFFERWRHVAGSISASSVRPEGSFGPKIVKPTRPSSGSFLDDWRAKRESDDALDDE